MESDALTPQPSTWPECGACKMPYVLRRVFVLSNGGEYEWLWVRDCKHKKEKPIVGGDNTAARQRARGVGDSFP